MKITFQNRDIVGKKVTGLRKVGLVPAVCYGSKETNTVCAVDSKELAQVLRSDEVVFETEGCISGKQVLIQEVIRDVITENPIHIDFLFIDATHEVEYDVPIHIEGEAPAVKLYGGQVVMPLDKLTVKALPQHLPSHLTLDISGVEEVGSHITAGQVSLPAKVTLVTDPDEIVISIVEQVEEQDSEDASPDMESIEATAEGKKKEDEAGDNEGNN